eukprot:NODE_1351_length_1999_cov_74.437100_g1143_i0.p1 GENE.NODE_1351_length_1999_cov_74.437100_g1143_i0~~NODE_1351_length_1999_cov_74.437100_g1143_i0.p1  ORF type:complete len:313 (+),score=83.22 NODE_1351_length_1999_cov_74.437100_g1143_i0:900-1838(+)
MPQSNPKWNWDKFVKVAQAALQIGLQVFGMIGGQRGSGGGGNQYAQMAQFGADILGMLASSGNNRGVGSRDGGGGANYGSAGAAGFSQDGKRAVPGDVFMISGCKDEQTSADVSNVGQFQLPANSGPGGAGGACTSAFVSMMYQQPDITMLDLLEGMRKSLSQRNFTQIPQLSTTRVISMTDKFALIGGGAPLGGLNQSAVTAGQKSVTNNTSVVSTANSGNRGAPAILSQPIGKLPTDAEMRRMFNELDKDRTGYLDWNEFLVVYSNMEHFGMEKTARKKLENLMKKYGVWNDGKLGYEEFALIMINLANQ